MAVFGSTSDGATIGVDVVVNDTGAVDGVVINELVAAGVVGVNVCFGLPINDRHTKG